MESLVKVLKCMYFNLLNSLHFSMFCFLVVFMNNSLGEEKNQRKEPSNQFLNRYCKQMVECF